MAEALVEIMIRCPLCLKTKAYAPGGLRLTLLEGPGRFEDAYYEFFCLMPDCRSYNKVRVDGEHAQVLYENGVSSRHFVVPAEFFERGEAQDPLTEDHVAEFLRQLT